MYDYHFKFYKSRAHYKSRAKKLGLCMFHCVLIVLASYRERRHRLIILPICIIIFNEFLFLILIPLLGCKTTSLGKMYGLSKVC